MSNGLKRSHEINPNGSHRHDGKGLLLASLDHPHITQVLMVNRRSSGLKHPKLTELIVPDFTHLVSYSVHLPVYDGCFYCAGISSFSMDEQQYSHITLYTTMLFARDLARFNPGMVFVYLSGLYADSSERGKIMWARIKGKTENALNELPFKAVCSFRPGFIMPLKGQKNVRLLYKGLKLIYPYVFPKLTLTYDEVATALIRVLRLGYDKTILEINEMKSLAKQSELDTYNFR
ncbi:epimerase [Spirosoma sp. RP8]|uniref:Epimerase n=1 Tax=Spirosoma liriopis TaxID=2937440 RepID=A0ABT0HST5_9BACT|nr:epimerase [Spirosoma liriopis]MCK8495207.1 epimerase [Spirosoma liriopis]